MVENLNRNPLSRFQTRLKAFLNSQANDYKLSASWEATQVFLFLASFSLFVCYCVLLYSLCVFVFSLIIFLSLSEMETSLAALKNHFPTLPQDVLRKIYKCRLERMRALTSLGLPEHIRWIIEAKVRLAGELNDSLIKRLPGLGRSSYSKKRRAKRMEVCHKCARCNCDTSCKNLGYLSINREDKIKCIKDGLSKESLDNIRETLETHPCGKVQCILLDL